MAKFLRNKENIGYLKLNYLEFVSATANWVPICDECLTDLTGEKEMYVVPCLNWALCTECGPETIERLKFYPDEKEYNDHKDGNWKRLLNIAEEGESNETK